jgi:general secretion pathway protein C
MTIDALLKKHFTWVVLGLVAVVAYFQASAAMHLFGGALVGSAPAAAAGLAPLAQQTMTEARRSRSADPLLERNPFDSVTGPLTGRPIDPITLPEPKADLSDPLGAPRCEGMILMIVTESTDPTWSVAAVQGPGEPHPRMRRVGDSVSGKDVAFIGFNPREASPAVWFSTPSEVCQALLFNTGPSPAPAPAAAPADDAQSPPPPSRGGTKVPDDIKDKIQRVSDNEFNVDRSVVDKILENQAELMRSARIVPEQKDGKVVGIRLFGIRPDTLLGSLGLQNGDRLESINGFNMASPEKALEAYARLRTASNLNVKVSRRGQSMSIDYRIK